MLSDQIPLHRYRPHTSSAERLLPGHKPRCPADKPRPIQQDFIPSLNQKRNQSRWLKPGPPLLHQPGGAMHFDFPMFHQKAGEVEVLEVIAARLTVISLIAIRKAK
jgi:hypothetical protein